MLELVELLQGGFALIYFIITLIVGLKIASRYFENKNIEYLLIGITWIGLAMVWSSDAFNFVLIVLLNSDPLSSEAYLIIGIGFIPVYVLCWLYAFTELLYKNYQKKIVLLSFIYLLIYEAFFWYFLFSDISILGTFKGPFYIEYNYFVIITSILVILIFIITATKFSLASLKSENPEHVLRGKLLLVAVYSFAIAALLDSSIPLSPLIVVITRLILITSSIEFYMAFVLPKWVKNLFIKEN